MHEGSAYVPYLQGRLSTRLLRMTKPSMRTIIFYFSFFSFDLVYHRGHLETFQ